MTRNPTISQHTVKIYTIIKTTSVGDARLSLVCVADWSVILTGWPVTVGVVDTRYGVGQPGADAERYRCACLHCTQGLAGRGDGVSVRPRLGAF